MNQELAELVEGQHEEATGDRVKPVLGGDWVRSNGALEDWDVDEEGCYTYGDRHGGKEARVLPGRILEDGLMSVPGRKHVAEELHHHQGDEENALSPTVGIYLVGSRESGVLHQERSKETETEKKRKVKQ